MMSEHTTRPPNADVSLPPFFHSAACVRALEPLDDLLDLRPRDRERHLVILGLSEDPVARAGEDDLRLIGPHGGHDDVRAHHPAPEGGRQLPAFLPERGLGQPHHLGRIAVDADDVRLECRAIERRHEETAVRAGIEAVHRGFRALPGLLGLGVHALAERARAEHVARLLEPEGRDAERADAVLAGQRDHPAVAPGHVDDLAIHAQLLEVTGGAAGAVGNRLAGAQHADRDGKRLRTHVRLQLAIRGLDVDHSASLSS